MRKSFILMCMLLCLAAPAQAQISIGIGLPNVSIGINLPIYPELVPVPGYPVYYAPQLDSNYFFYDGMYWVYQGDNWYASSWYNGPWGMVGPEVVPVFVLRIPVRYYRQAPSYFRGWRQDAPPRWGEHWGNDWSQRHNGWDRWDRRAAPARPPLPVYQKQYSGERYPRGEQQQSLQSQNYRYQPRDPVVRQHVEAQRAQPVQRGTQGSPQDRNPGQQDNRRGNPAPPQQQAQPSRGEPQRGQPQEAQGQGRPQEQNRGQRSGQDRNRDNGDRGGRGDRGDRGEGGDKSDRDRK